MNDVCFVKTPNTVTVGCGLIGRTFQVILRLYESKADVLNGFDIDCCCVGYDGTQALITPRCITALRTRINTVNLEIRGESYECRLLKYVERGFRLPAGRLAAAPEALRDGLQHRCSCAGSARSGEEDRIG